MAIDRRYQLRCDCCDTKAASADSRAGAKVAGRRAGWSVADGADRAARCPRCVTHVLALDRCRPRG